jgi:DNA polymerase III epsilon subunit-like protein
MPINHYKYAITDFETGGITKNRQPLSIGCVMLDPRKLTICDNGVFYSLIQPVEDEDCLKFGLDPIDNEALMKNGLTMDELRKAPPIKKVFAEFVEFIKYHNPKAKKWDAPIFTGWNFTFDWEIMENLCDGLLEGRHTILNKLPAKTTIKKIADKEIEIFGVKEPWGFGPPIENLFRPFPQIEVSQYAFSLFESTREPHLLNISSVKAHLGFQNQGMHNALVDCLWTAELFARFLRLQRIFASEIDFKTEGETFLDIQAEIDKFEKKRNNS